MGTWCMVHGGYTGTYAWCRKVVILAKMSQIQPEIYHILAKNYHISGQISHISGQFYLISGQFYHILGQFYHILGIFLVKNGHFKAAH